MWMMWMHQNMSHGRSWTHVTILWGTLNVSGMEPHHVWRHLRMRRWHRINVVVGSVLEHHLLFVTS